MLFEGLLSSLHKLEFFPECRDVEIIESTETSLSVIAQALSAIVAPQDSGADPEDRCPEIRSAGNLEERLQNWGSD